MGRAWDKEPGLILQAKTWGEEIQQDIRPPRRNIRYQAQPKVTVAPRRTTVVSTDTPPQWPLVSISIATFRLWDAKV